MSLVLVSGCAESAHQSGRAAFDKLVAADLRDQIDRSVSFSELKADPDKFKGRVLLLGGDVLSAKRRQDETEIEVLQLPLNKALAPIQDRAQSQGRFLAARTEFLDPATLTAGMPITVVGQVLGATTRTVDEAPYIYPLLEIKQLAVGRGRGGPYAYSGSHYYRPYYGGYYGDYWDPFWGSYGPYYYPYRYWVPSVPIPPPSRPAQIPPQFQKR